MGAIYATRGRSPSICEAKSGSVSGEQEEGSGQASNVLLDWEKAWERMEGRDWPQRLVSWLAMFTNSSGNCVGMGYARSDRLSRRCLPVGLCQRWLAGVKLKLLKSCTIENAERLPACGRA